MYVRCTYDLRAMVARGAQQAAANKADIVVLDNIHIGGIKLSTEPIMGFRD